MNKDIWERIDRLEELAGKATQGEWVSDRHGNIDLTERFYLADNLTSEDAEYIAAANPAMILEMIAEMRRLEKEANWLALSLSKVGNTEVFCCPENELYKPIMECVSEHGSCAKCWREAARKAIANAQKA